MKALVVNCSKGYNLGANKLKNYLIGQGYKTDFVTGDPKDVTGYDLVALSVVFSWDAPLAKRIAAKTQKNSDVWCGGPGMFALKNWWKKETNLDCVAGVDLRFDKQFGQYKMTFASRGCPVNCSFCIVPKMEGTEFTLNWDFIPAPILCDNNLSALPSEFQDHIINTYKTSDVTLKDANSGFEPRTFTDETYHRWKSILKGKNYWRFAFDTLSEEFFVENMIKTLEKERSYKKRVYVLIGNEPFESCYYRLKKVIDWGCEPHVQPIMALNTLEKKPVIRYDWTEQKLKDVARWANRWIWRKTPLYDYQPRKNEKPFIDLKPKKTFVLGVRI